jgi:hypothetical protein
VADSPSIYVFDTNSLRVFGNYYPEHFPSFWDGIEELAAGGRLLSVKEVSKELELQNTSEHVAEWAERNRNLFGAPTEDEMTFVAAIFRVPHFQQLIGEKQRLTGMPVADPFLVARGKQIGGCVVTEEVLKPHAAKIPNVCEHFGVRSINVRQFLGELGWVFR